MKRIVLQITLLIFLLSLLTGCSGGLGSKTSGKRELQGTYGLVEIAVGLVPKDGLQLPLKSHHSEDSDDEDWEDLLDDDFDLDDYPGLELFELDDAISIVRDPIRRDAYVLQLGDDVKLQLVGVERKATLIHFTVSQRVFNSAAGQLTVGGLCATPLSEGVHIVGQRYVDGTYDMDKGKLEFGLQIRLNGIKVYLYCVAKKAGSGHDHNSDLDFDDFDFFD